MTFIKLTNGSLISADQIVTVTPVYFEDELVRAEATLSNGEKTRLTKEQFESLADRIIQ